MKTSKHKFHSPRHLFRILVSAHGKNKDIRLKDSYEDNKNSFYIELHDEFLDEEIENLELKLLEVKQKIKEKKY